jgi:septal ring factor EnvC (AmiA/AmiB activator)
MEWVSDVELNRLDEFLRGNTDAGSPSAFLATLDGLSTICKTYPRVVHELRSLRGESQRLRQQVALTSEQTRKLEAELRMARAQIEGLERQVRAA